MSELVVISISDLRELIASTVRAELSKISIPAAAPITDEIFDIKQAAQFLGLSVATLYTLHGLPSMKKGKRLYYSKTELITWLKSGRKKTSAEIDSEVDQVIKKQKRKV
jgi:predicted DNA-binding transcriptional regulator AlpA